MEDQRHVVGGIEKRQQVVELEDEAALFEPHAAQIPPQRAAVIDGLAVQPHPAFVRIDDCADNVEEVLLPDPDGPSRPMTSPEDTVKVRLSEVVSYPEVKQSSCSGG
jgi:hypothetical protein